MDVIHNLYHTGKDFQTIMYIINESTRLGRHVDFSDSMHIIHTSQMNFFERTFERAVRGELSVEDMERLEAYSEGMQLFTELLPGVDERARFKQP